MKNHIQEIKQSPLFSGIKESDLVAMLNCVGAAIKNYRKGEIILLTNDEVPYVGVILKGSVHMVIENITGEQTLLSIIREGELFGESFVCGDGLSSYTTFSAAHPATVLFMPFHKVMHTCTMKCEFHHRLIENMITMVANKNVRLMQKIDVSSQKTIRRKILSYLRMLSLEQNSLTVDLAVSRTVWAEYLGVHRSALSRELASMKEEGVLDFRKNRFYLKEE